MKINHSLALQLMAESPSFRLHVASIFFPNHDKIVEKVCAAVFAASGKIDAIKRVATIYEENPQAFFDAYPHAELVEYAGRKSLGFAWCKNLVESFGFFN